MHATVTKVSKLIPAKFKSSAARHIVHLCVMVNTLIYRIMKKPSHLLRHELSPIPPLTTINLDLTVTLK